jgi:hypothetical protein
MLQHCLSDVFRAYELFGMFLHSYEALVAGEIKGKCLSIEDMMQVEPENLEEMDLQRRMAMMTFRAKCHLEKTGNKRIDGKRAGFDKSKLRCFNCKQLSHFKRDCPMPVQNQENTPAPVIMTENDGANQVEKDTKKALTIQDMKWGQEVEEAQVNICKALMAKICEPKAKIDEAKDGVESSEKDKNVVDKAYMFKTEYLK